MINMNLAKEKNLSDKTIRRIESLHDHLDKVLKEPYFFVPTPDKVDEYIQSIEYYLQELWGFPQDPHFHSHWYKVKWCKCPKQDNMERVGSYMGRFNTGECPYHGLEVSRAKSWDNKIFGEEE